MELNSTAYMWRVLENGLPPNIKSEVKGMTMFQDRYVSSANDRVMIFYSIHIILYIHIVYPYYILQPVPNANM